MIELEHYADRERLHIIIRTLCPVERQIWFTNEAISYAYHINFRFYVLTRRFGSLLSAFFSPTVWQDQSSLEKFPQKHTLKNRRFLRITEFN